MYRLLLVDDEKMVLVSVRHAAPWAKHGFSRVQETTNPREALLLLEKNRIDAACVDIRMPDLSAFDLIQNCKDRDIRTVFLILTGYSDFQYAQQALRLGVYDFLLKPLQPEDAEIFLPKLAAHVRELRLREDPPIYMELLRGQNTRQKLIWLGLDLSKAYLGLLVLSGRLMDSESVFLQENLDCAVLLLRPDQTVLFFTADTDPTQKISEFTSRLTPPCGASLYLIGKNLEYLPSALAKAKLESEEIKKQSVISSAVELRVHNILGNQPWNDSFLRLMQEVESRYTEALSLSELAEKYNISYSYCSSLFTQRVGTSFSKYISDLRMSRAKELLETTSLPIGVICEQVGYQDYHYFAKTFRKTFGQTPSEYRAAER